MILAVELWRTDTTGIEMTALEMASSNGIDFGFQGSEVRFFRRPATV